MFKKIALMMVLFGLSLNLQAERVPVSSGQYYGGGVVGTLIGFGIGHAIQGRYGDMGWIFTVGEIGGAVIMGGGAAWMVAPLKDKGIKYKDAKWSDLSTGGTVLFVAGNVLLAGFRIWEIVDVWAAATPVDNPKTASFFMNKDDKLFAGAHELGVASLSVLLFAMNF